MRYKSFTILKYRAIESPLKVDISKHSLVPIIGINECGKTTILHAILAFDYYNDAFNKNLHHLDDTNNLYKLGQDNQASIMAEVSLSWNDFKACINDIATNENKSICNSYKRKSNDFTENIHIVRDLHTKAYRIDSDVFLNHELNAFLAEKIISKLPYILYFDDFRDSVPDKIDIIKPTTGKPEGWLAIVERLFSKTDKNLSVFKLDGLDERERKSTIAKINKALNTTLSREWQNFKLDNSDALNISLEYVPPSTSSDISENAYIKFEIVEKDEEGNEHYFYVRDRSKGFFWFFNFVMKLEFNPKVISNDGVDAIYLLDEPGSYLHAAAQGKLCNKLKSLSDKNAVIYCTHSHYLLDPAVVPISHVKIASKNKNMEVSLNSIYDYRDTDTTTEKRNAFQPVYDALQIKPFKMDIGRNEKVILAEGIYDFYCFDMLFEGYRIVPGQNADSINYYIALMIGWGVDFNAIWDNDDEGRSAKEKSDGRFGDIIAQKTHLLPLNGNAKSVILQNLFKNNDLSRIRSELEIPANSSFTKTISTLYYSSNRTAIISKCISDNTREAFRLVESTLSFKDSNDTAG